ncbi:MAG: nitrilase-related carbon-nitrogen hydrolase, partial [Sphingomicrobium sp.]
MSAVRIALYQAQSGIDPAANAEKLVGAVRDAAAGGAAMLFTPEMSGMLDRDRDRALGKARSEEEDHVLAAVRKAAAEAGIWVHLGSLALKGDSGKLVNRGFVIDGQGEVRARYDKIHLFDVDLPTGESWRESVMYEAGHEAVIVPDTPVGRLGLTICYDLRFPELSRLLTLMGAEILVSPSGWVQGDMKVEHWQTMV